MLAGQLANARRTLAVFVGGAVRKVEAGNVHAGQNQLFQHAGLITGGADCGDNFGAA